MPGVYDATDKFTTGGGAYWAGRAVAILFALPLFVAPNLVATCKNACR